mmetsp:Transcript_1884/g.2906  ORF Transcript_1884/g.2906 Transcript_1884/m.2906 type:complete len:163 (-) Transcript_1884:695-1183(-)
MYNRPRVALTQRHVCMLHGNYGRFCFLGHLRREAEQYQGLVADFHTLLEAFRCVVHVDLNLAKRAVPIFFMMYNLVRGGGGLQQSHPPIPDGGVRTTGQQRRNLPPLAAPPLHPVLNDLIFVRSPTSPPVIAARQADHLVAGGQRKQARPPPLRERRTIAWR